jgi:phage baseplate assembly protein V
MIARLFRRVQQSIGIGRTKAAPDDSGIIQTVQVKISALDLRDGVPVAYHFGFAAALPVGTDVVVTAIAGDPSNSIVVASNNQEFRPTGLKPGEAMLYDNLGRTIKLDQAAGIVANANGANVTIENADDIAMTATGTFALTAPTVTVNGNLTVTDNLTVDGTVLSGEGGADQVNLQTHRHSASGGSGEGGPPVAGT